MPPLDLTRRRDLGELLGVALRLWLRHLPVFAALAFIVVAPVLLLVDGLWAGTLEDDPFDADGAAAPLLPGVVSAVLQAVVVPAVVTAMHVVAVQDLARGRRPAVARSARAALAVALPVALVVGLYTVAVGLGLLALVVPGVWLAVRWYFGAQAAVVDQARGTGALRASAELVRGRWWRVFGILLVLGVLGSLAAVAAAALLGLLVGLAGGAGAGFVVGNLLVQTLVVSWTALAGTLVFFDLRARQAPAWPAAQAPERPDVGLGPSPA
jgi:hypothetical protein